MIKIEIGLREPLLDKKTTHPASTLLLNPFTGKPVVSPITVSCLSKQETYAEKIRATLTRRTPAIRDFFDISYAKQMHTVDITAPGLLNLARKKIALSEEGSQKLSEQRIGELSKQLTTELQPVLRQEDFETFSLEEAISLVQEIQKKLEYSPA